MKPTYEDIIKYHSQKTKLLVNIEYYAHPIEIQIHKVIDDGAVFRFNNGLFLQWVKTQDVDVLHIFPPQELLDRLASLQDAEKQEIITKATSDLQQFQKLQDVFAERDLPSEAKKKKGRKKKNEH